ncbi:hypothetical protein F2Q68_00024879 [Brassica cretica]|uniref:Uncharacterized protein n=1 Tax=Brassica cretica TaxID=69181 RepID=A0A8S9I8A2_BRACR|nr:hypothetical protein F2Q68_00024879 [Brassica cretica]
MLREDLKINKTQTLEDALHRSNLFIELEEEKEAMAKKYATTRMVATKEKLKEESRESRSRDHRDKPGTNGPEQTIQQGTANFTRGTGIQRWNACTCKNTYLGKKVNDLTRAKIGTDNHGPESTQGQEEEIANLRSARRIPVELAAQIQRDLFGDSGTPTQ